MRVAFVHPDLGIGGAERLVVDAATGLQGKGHTVCVFTSHHDRGHCFDETKDGTLDVRVRGDFFPRTTFGKFYIVWAIVRNIFAAFCVLFSKDTFDVIFVDQLSVCIPILRLNPRHRIVFYCHFPDKLLATRTSCLKKLYRIPMDFIEQLTTGQADLIMVNSQFTAGHFHDAFPGLRHIKPEVLYPSINLPLFDAVVPDGALLSQLAPGKRLIVSINRFERKKAIGLAVEALALLQKEAPLRPETLQLIVAGGYDKRVTENVEYHLELTALAKAQGLTTSDYPDLAGQVVFMRSISAAAKTALLQRCEVVVYTPANEHFGIVPIEAMAASKPVVAQDSGGPLESIRDGETGVLCQNSAESMARALSKVLSSDPAKFGRRGREVVEQQFSLSVFSSRLDSLVRAVAARPVGVPLPVFLLIALLIVAMPLVTILAY